MAEAHSWTFLDSSATVLKDVAAASVTFPDQAEAEAWMSEHWADLAEAGVDAVILMRGDDTVYGPMSVNYADPD